MDRLPAGVDVVRSLGTAPEFRQVAGEIGTLTGHFSVFNDWYEVSSMWEGDFLERVAPGAYAQTIAEDAPGMRVLFDHGFDPQLGNKVLGPIESLAEDARGAAYEVPLFDTSYNRDLLPGLRAGVYGASMRMRVMDDVWDDEPMPSGHNPKGLPERSITRAKVMEFGPVTFPASPTASAGVRSMTDHFYDQLQRHDRQAYAGAVRAAGRRVPRTATRATDATIEELVAAADALVDEVEAALASGDVEGATALLTALDETVDSQMVLLGIPDTDEADSDAMASTRPRGAARPKNLTGRSGAWSAGGGGSKDDGPGNGTTSARSASLARHHELVLRGVLK